MAHQRHITSLTNYITTTQPQHLRLGCNNLKHESPTPMSRTRRPHAAMSNDTRITAPEPTTWRRKPTPACRTTRGRGLNTDASKRIRPIDSNDTKVMPTPTSRMTRENGGPAADVERHDNGWVSEQSRLALDSVFYYYINCSMYLQIQGGSPSLRPNIFGGTNPLCEQLIYLLVALISVCETKDRNYKCYLR
jgi:hypothetical protein